MKICIDFDGTIVKHEYPQVGEPVPEALSVMHDLADQGHQLILFTMRSGPQLADAVDYLKDEGVKLFGINTCPGQSDWTSSPKAYGQLYIDDAALGCPLVHNILEDRPHVDWDEVRDYLVINDILKAED